MTSKIRAKQVLRRELDLLTHPPVQSEAAKPEAMMISEVETEEPVAVEAETGSEPVKLEESEEKEEIMGEEGLFTDDFDELMDPSQF